MCRIWILLEYAEYVENAEYGDTPDDLFSYRIGLNLT